MDIRIVDGRLTKDAEVKTSKNNGRQFLSFTLANNGYFKNEQITTYFNVISYDKDTIEQYEKYSKGTYVIVNGRPNESMSIKDSKTYLNRNIIAYNVTRSASASNRNENNQTANYRDVAPAVPSVDMPSVNIPTCEAPVMVAPVQTTAPKVNENAPIYSAEVPSMSSTAPQASKNYDDDLPF